MENISEDLNVLKHSCKAWDLNNKKKILPIKLYVMDEDVSSSEACGFCNFKKKHTMFLLKAEKNLKFVLVRRVGTVSWGRWQNIRWSNTVMHHHKSKLDRSPQRTAELQFIFQQPQILWKSCDMSIQIIFAQWNITNLFSAKKAEAIFFKNCAAFYRPNQEF